MKTVDSTEKEQFGLWEELGEGVATPKPRIQTAQKHSSSPALDPDDSSLVLWAESPAEARNFLDRAARSGISLPIEKIFVAKRSPVTRTNAYIGGLYHPATNDEAVNVYERTVYAPPAITDLVQWCTCDIMLSYGCSPCVVLEDTTHLIRMNLYQRIPRIARAASLGVPSLVLQSTHGLNFKLRGDRWGLYRYLQAFEAIARIYPKAPSLPVLYEHIASEERKAQDFVFKHISAILNGDTYAVESQRAQVISNIRSTIKSGVDGDIARDIASIDHIGHEVVVRIGAKPEKKSWREKGSGQMDTYVGLILAAKYIYCYDEAGNQAKKLVVEFTHLPLGFWFFKDPETTALYKRLPLLFADEVRWLGKDTSGSVPL